MPDAMHQSRYLIPFRSLLLPHIFTDVLVIGGGVAGMRAALEASAAGSDVIVLLKADTATSSTAWSQGGIAAVVEGSDSIEAHVADTLRAGADLCDPQTVRTLVEEAPDEIAQLQKWGMQFDRNAAGDIDLGREGGHGQHRILHAGGAATGRELVRCLGAQVRSRDNIRLFEQCFALDLLSIENGDRASQRILGAITHHPKYGLQIIWAKATILCTGGVGQVYRETTNPRVVTGDGLAMAYRAGAKVMDLEFIQFHPTTLYVAGSTRSLISEAVRGEGAWLVDRDGRRFMPDYHEMAELAPRDVVSRAIMNELARTQEVAVYLDVRHLAQFAQRFPSLTAVLRSFDLDPASDLIPVHPSAHYTIGGVWTDLNGQTSLPGLFACGEAAANGVHGANRLASNSLLEGLVFGRRAGRAAAAGRQTANGPARIISDIHQYEHGELDLTDVRSSLRSVMWRNVGIERSNARLADVVDMFQFWSRYTLTSIFDEPDGWETQNMLTVGYLITQAAQWRKETRGVHARSDFPLTEEDYRAHATWQCDRQQPEVLPVSQSVETVP